MSSHHGGAAAPAGWYPMGDGTQRYWDGTAWTEHVAPGPGPTPAAGPGPGAGRPVPFDLASAVVAPTDITNDDRTTATLIHVLALVAGFLGPLILWLAKRDQSPFVDQHGKEALNFQFSMLIYWLVAFVAILVLVGLLLIPILFVLQILFPILAAVAANRGERYTYPLTIRFLR